MDKEEAIRQYGEAYKHYSAVSITQEEAAIRMNEASRRALNMGVTLQALREARHQVDYHAEFMTDHE